MKICILGAGNVASHLARAFCQANHDVVVWNRSESPLLAISEELQCRCTTDVRELPTDADAYIISVKDDAVRRVAELLSSTLSCTKPVVAHTAGSVSLEVLSGHFENAGVFYPLQTFSKDKSLNYSEVPFFVEGSGVVIKTLRDLAGTVSEHVYEMSSEQRKILHLASVFACNFTNHCYAISEKILSEISIPFNVMLPLIRETLDKVATMTPVKSQTGPAAREDYDVIESQMSLLEGNEVEQELYRLFSKNIITYKHND